MLHPRDQIDRPFEAASADGEQPDLVRAKPPREPHTSVERDRVAEGVETDAPTVEQLGAELTEAERAAGLEKERSLLGEQDGEPGQIDHLTVRLHLGEVGVRREVERERRRGGKLGVQADLQSSRAEVQHAVGPIRRILELAGLRRRGAVRSELRQRTARQPRESRNEPLVWQEEDPLGASPPPPQHVLVLASDEPFEVHASQC